MLGSGRFGPHSVQDDVHLAIYTGGGAMTDFEASFELTHTAQLASGAFVLRARDAAHYYMIEIPESGIATRDGFEGIYVRMLPAHPRPPSCLSCAGVAGEPNWR